MIPDLFDRRLILVSGKGGIGKTTIACLLGIWAARTGKRTLLVESAAHDQLAPMFGLPPCGHTETLVAPDLAVINLNTRENFREYIVKYLGLGHLFEKIFAHDVVTSFIETIPGIAELILLGRLFYSAKLKKDKPYDLVVFDGHASGHFLNLMTTPQAVADAGIVGPVRNEADRIKEFLATECSIVLVTTLDDLAAEETIEFFPKLAERSPAKPSLLIVNKTLIDDKRGQWKPAAEQFAAWRPAMWRYLERRLIREGKNLDAVRAAIQLPAWMVRDKGSISIPMTNEWVGRVIEEDLWSL